MGVTESELGVDNRLHVEERDGEREREREYRMWGVAEEAIERVERGESIEIEGGL